MWNGKGSDHCLNDSINFHLQEQTFLWNHKKKRNPFTVSFFLYTMVLTQKNLKSEIHEQSSKHEGLVLETKKFNNAVFNLFTGKIGAEKEYTTKNQTCACEWNIHILLVTFTAKTLAKSLTLFKPAVNSPSVLYICILSIQNYYSIIWIFCCMCLMLKI